MSIFDENEFSRWIRSSILTLESAKRDRLIETITGHVLNLVKPLRKLSKFFYEV